jgi:hypothetical protein
MPVEESSVNVFIRLRSFAFSRTDASYNVNVLVQCVVASVFSPDPHSSCSLLFDHIKLWLFEAEKEGFDLTCTAYRPDWGY